MPVAFNLIIKIHMLRAHLRNNALRPHHYYYFYIIYYFINYPCKSCAREATVH